jgi:type IV pilus assembly protein PilC
MKFNFKAKTSKGTYETGVINASSREVAVETLQRNNLLPLRVEEEKKKSQLVNFFLKFYDRVSEKELVVFFRQLSILIEARVPIIVSLTAIKEQTSNLYLARVIQEIMENIEDGMPLSSAMEKHKNIFSNLSINILKAGEASGNLKKSIDYVAENIERNYALYNRVKSALIYPAIVVIVFFIIGFLAVTFIVPKLTSIIKELNAIVPWYTQIVIVVGDFMAAYWWAVAFAILGMIGGVFYYLRSEEGKGEWDRMKIRLPIVGVIFQYVYITRFSENLGVLLAGGIPIIKALTIVSSVINNVVYEEIFLKASEEVKRGGNMSTVLRREALIPPMVSHMIKIGEESGQIDSVLKHISRFYDQETELMTKNLSTLIEPVLMIMIGIAVGFMSFAILMPIYNIAGQIQ